jgi:hypothetical protein
MANLPPFRLKSRKPLWKEEFLMQPFSKSDYWKAAWQDVDIFNKNLIEDPTKQIPGFDLPMKIWCKLNRFRTGHGKLSPEHTLSVFEGVCRRLTVTEWTCRVFLRPIAPQFSRTHAR